jgi:RNA polymerase sigma factor for flagellar operon FliA
MTLLPDELSETQYTEALPVLDIALAQVGRRLPAYVSREDLASAAKIALISALRQVRGPREQVHAYCFTRVRGAILDELRRIDPLSRRVRAKVNALQAIADTLAQETGRQASEVELASAAGIELAQVRAVRSLVESARTVSIDETNEEGAAWRELEDQEAICPAQRAQSADAAAALREAITRLPKNHALVLRRYYFEEATLEEIAFELGVSKERIRQIREAAERKLRQDTALLGLAA